MTPLFSVIPLFILTLFYIANSGGYGIALPFNLTFLCWLGSLVMLLIWRYRKGDADRQPLLLAGGLLLLVSGFMQVKENPGVWVLLGAVFLWQGLRASVIHITLQAYDSGGFICAGARPDNGEPASGFLSTSRHAAL
ncbi:hypothetical protein [Cronobacter sakazakii]|uniref:hypothetical protein n=1 Tax=Cronobacter sakazakii TaxID=28141 RepID=UPI001F1FD5B2|nr:hypothetical protein [Cronobacter sakazakii]